MSSTVLFITPPFTQLNTPYPATPYLKGYLNNLGITSFQTDLGLEVMLQLFSKQGLINLFDEINQRTQNSNIIKWNDNIKRIISLKEDYINTIDAVIKFLQGYNHTLAHCICKREFLPEALRFESLPNLTWAFGTMGIQDHAKYLATMYLEDLNDLIKEFIDPYFGFSRYAEHISRSANSFDVLHTALQQDFTFTDRLLIKILEDKIKLTNPLLVAISVPFPGNLYSALRCGKWIKNNFTDIMVVMGGGYANTELRNLEDTRVFECLDFISLDDGELPLEQIIKLCNKQISLNQLVRTYTCINSEVVFVDDKNNLKTQNFDNVTPDYSDLLLNKYISAIEIANPMHALWSNGRWNKLTVAHGCYWAKCTFCDTSLNYIEDYRPYNAKLLCNKIETIIEQTGETGFHFVDEAAPPALLRELAIEIINRKIVISWWANIRFEKNFTRDLCLLLKASGCIAVSGGLEVASNRLLKLINKGITVEQVTQVTNNFTEAGIMVHAYLMYGFPTQTEQETIDSLEIVRQMFNAGILHSGFWHLFTTTVHSPIGKNPEQFGIKTIAEEKYGFAKNDIKHADPKGADHEAYSEGLHKAIFNYMQGLGLDFQLNKWFDFKVAKTKIQPDYISNILKQPVLEPFNHHSKIIWLGNIYETEVITKSKNGKQWDMLSISFQTKKETINIKVDKDKGLWLIRVLEQLKINTHSKTTLKDIMGDYENCGFEDFELYWDNKPVNGLYKAGLLRI